MPRPDRPRLSRRALIGGLAALGVAGCTGPGTPNPPTDTPSAGRSAKPKATDPLTGGRRSRREVFAVKIENTAAARPQVGLADADIVVVEEVEARITRLIAIFHTAFPRRVGPVRSARNTDLRLLPLFGKPGLVYSGANAKVQRQIAKASVVAIERSDRDRTRSAPHNVMVDLKALAGRYRVGKAQDIGWRFADAPDQWRDAERANRATAKVGADTMRFDFADGRYDVRWNGQTYRAGKGNVRTDNVVVMSVKNRRDSDTTSAISVVSETTGRGAVTVYRDGRKLTGTWSRPRVADPLRLTTKVGEDILLHPGQTWLMLQG